MRVIKFLFSSFLVLAVIAGGAFLITREVLLQWALSTVRQSLGVLRQDSVHAGAFFLDCQKKGGVVSDTQPLISAFQLRFTSSTEYVLEVVCAQFPSDPILVSSHQLPMFVTKIPGQAGILWGNERSGIGLQVWGRSRAILASDREVQYETASKQLGGLGVGPAAACQGYGFMCCPSDSSVGVGEQIGSATDCPKTCYQSCAYRPVVLSLVTQPFFDPKLRVLSVAEGESVEFSYVLDVIKTKGATGTLDFGDGEQVPLSIPRGQATHTYSCSNSAGGSGAAMTGSSQGRCQFTAQILLQDGAGVEIADTPVRSVRIVVQ